MKTTVPFIIGRDEKVLYNKRQPIFNQIPIKEDFEIAISQIDFDGSERILLDLGILKITISTSKNREKYFLSHENSIGEIGSNYLIGGFETYDGAISVVKNLIQREIESLKGFERYLERAMS